MGLLDECLVDYSLLFNFCGRLLSFSRYFILICFRVLVIVLKCCIAELKIYP